MIIVIFILTAMAAVIVSMASYPPAEAARAFYSSVFTGKKTAVDRLRLFDRYFAHLLSIYPPLLVAAALYIYLSGYTLPAGALAILGLLFETGLAVMRERLRKVRIGIPDELEDGV